MFNKILIAIDGSATADKALREAVALASQQRAQLTILYVLSVISAMAQMQMANESLYESHLEGMRHGGRRLLDRAVSIAAAAGLEAKTTLREAEVANVADAITSEARNGFDLLVLGTHGRRGFDRLLLGSCAEQVLRTATIPVLLIRADEGQKRIEDQEAKSGQRE
jgi:nucleotide-binding universal stress UspA family protein